MILRRSIVCALPLTLLMMSCNKPSTSGTSDPPVTTRSPAAAATPDQFAEARGLFAKNCQTCHQPTGTGGPVKLEDGTKLKVPSLREGHALRHSDADFVKQINKGGDGMPAFKDKLTSQQMEELVRFIRHDFQGGAQPLAK